MARRTRSQLPDGLVHVTARGNRRQTVYTDASDYERFLGTVSDVCRRLPLRIHAYCLLDNHYHLLADALQPDLSLALHRLNGTYAQAFNRRHDLDGHLFQDRFHSVAVTSEWHLFELLRYIVLNPVRAGICGSPAEYPWSSYRATVGLEHAPGYLAVDTVLARFGDDPERARRSFAAFVDEALPRLSHVAA